MNQQKTGMLCPVCRKDLVRENNSGTAFFRCPECGGRMVTMPAMRKRANGELANKIWNNSQYGLPPAGKSCPICSRNMCRTNLTAGGRQLELDVCRSCQLIWFDPGELDTIPVPEKPQEEELPPRAREILAMHQIRKDEEYVNTVFNTSGDTPDNSLEYLAGLLGMPVKQSCSSSAAVPFVTYTAAVLCTAIFILTSGHTGNLIADWGFIPSNWSRHTGLTIFSSMFIHADLLHLLGNMYFLLIFGGDTERELGRVKYILLLLISGISALIFHSVIDPRSTVPCVGASGFISGIIAFFAVKFPRAKISFMIFRNISGIGILGRRNWITLPAIAVFILWLLLQTWLGILSIDPAVSGTAGLGVAFFAHIGGTVPGLLLGFWQRCRKTLSQEDEYRQTKIL